MTQSTMRVTVNGKTSDVDAAPDTALLYVLRKLSVRGAVDHERVGSMV